MVQGEGQNLCLGAQGVEGVGEEERAEEVLGKDQVAQDVRVSALSQSSARAQDQHVLAEEQNEKEEEGLDEELQCQEVHHPG